MRLPATGEVAEPGVALVPDVRGHQGLARLPGLGDRVAGEHAPALAMTRVLLAASPAYLQAVTTVLDGLDGFDVAALHRELDAVRRRGYAVDEEGFAPGLCTVAAPVAAPTGEVTVAVGVSTSARRFTTGRSELVAAVRAVAEETGRRWVAGAGSRAAAG